NEARFGLRYQVTGEFPAWQSSDGDVVKATEQWILSGGANSNGVKYPVAFTPAGIGNGALSITAAGPGNTTPLYNYADTFSWTIGRHALKFGADIRLTRSNGYNGNSFPSVTGGAPTGFASALTSTSNFTSQLPDFLSTARGNSANLLYFMSAS